MNSTMTDGEFVKMVKEDEEELQELEEREKLTPADTVIKHFKSITRKEQETLLSSLKRILETLRR